MLDLTQSDEFLALRSAVRTLTADRVSGAVPHPDACAAVPDEALRALAGMGLLTPREVEDGGQGIPDHLGWTAIAEELGRGDAGTALDVVVGAYAAILVSRCGTQAQRRALAPAGAAPVRGTVLYFEGFGRSPLELKTTVTDEGGPVLTGRKVAVVRAGSSGFGVAVGRDGDEVRAVYLPHAALASLSTVRDDTASGKIGARAAATSVVDLADLRGGEPLDGGAPIDLHRCLAGMRLAVASILLGTADAAIGYAARYASEREAFGRPIAACQGVAFPLVDAEIGVEAARLAVQDLAADGDRIDDPVLLAERTAVAVAAVTQAAAVATATAVNVLGGHGYLTDHPVERWYRDAAALAAIDFDPLLTDWSATS